MKQSAPAKRVVAFRGTYVDGRKIPSGTYIVKEPLDPRDPAWLDKLMSGRID